MQRSADDIITSLQFRRMTDASVSEGVDGGEGNGKEQWMYDKPTPRWAATSAGVMSRLGGGSGRGRRCSRRLLSFLYNSAANARMLRNNREAPTAMRTLAAAEYLLVDPDDVYY
ncbi:hypothetical protein EYF80_033827 [Liparis tanakae]|uniref:Uncharacterized protein n=1 Tax=Liparis tanakae TaxID=230148 RepID=A0A4Z2GRQ7_9TELE|nr:hypothetical protein EYF80_033827 [Liparis tanakae]